LNVIFRLNDLIPSSDCTTQIETGQWVRAMHIPFRGGLLDRLHDALAVFRGEAYAVRWPNHGEFEQAMIRKSLTDE
jgi:hypothetical protein